MEDPMKPNNAYLFILTGLILLGILACNGSFSVEFPTATPPVPGQPATLSPATLPPDVPTPANLSSFVISKYCIAELQKQPVGFDPVFSTGAAPTPENYEDWNLTADHLIITFDTYQVAPGASGPQTISIPYSELQAVLHPQGPLASFAR
jgi:hypothetical protein